MIYAAGQRKPTFKRIGDIGFDLLRRHAGVKRGDDDDWNIDRRKEVNRHTNQGNGADDDDDQTQHDDKVGVLD